MATKTKREQGLCTEKGCSTKTRGHRSLCEKHRDKLRDRPAPPTFDEGMAALRRTRAAAKKSHEAGRPRRKLAVAR